MEVIRQKLTEIVRLLSDYNEKYLYNTQLIIKILNKKPGEENEEQYLTSKMALHLLGISEKTLYNRRKAKQIPYMKVGGTYWYRLSDIQNITGEM